MNKDLLEGFKEWFREKNTSSLYVVFLLSYFAWNWRFFYGLTANHENLPESINNLQYAESLRHGVAIINTRLPDFFDFILLQIINFCGAFLIPITTTFFVIWYLPYVNSVAHKKGLKFFYDRKIEYHKQNNIYMEEKSKILKVQGQQTAENIDLLKDLEIKQKEELALHEKIRNENPQSEWEHEFQIFIKSNSNISAIKKANIILYKNSGYYDTSDTNRVNYIFALYLSSLDVNGIIELDSERSTLNFTKKGRYFLKRMQELNMFDEKFDDF